MKEEWPGKCYDKLNMVICDTDIPFILLKLSFQSNCPVFRLFANYFILFLFYFLFFYLSAYLF